MLPIDDFGAFFALFLTALFSLDVGFLKITSIRKQIFFTLVPIGLDSVYHKLMFPIIYYMKQRLFYLTLLILVVYKSNYGHIQGVIL
jgi:hypothetical protein